MLHRLPNELFNAVTEEVCIIMSKRCLPGVDTESRPYQLSITDLKSLCATSKSVRASAEQACWRSVTITPPHEYALYGIRVARLPQIYFDLATELHLHSTFRYNTEYRCPHADDDEQKTPDSSDTEEDDQYRDQLYFDRLTQKAKSVLQKFRNGQLHSFR